MASGLLSNWATTASAKAALTAAYPSRHASWIERSISGRVRQAPQRVLDEPEQRVRDRRCSTRRTHGGRARASTTVGASLVRATTRSSSVLALAIHVTSCCSRSAAQSGDEPAAAAPLDPRAALVAVVGDRAAVRDDDQRAPARACQTVMMLARARVPAGQPVEEHQPVAQEARRQEVPAHVLLALAARASRLARVAQDLDARLRALARPSRRASRSRRRRSGRRSRRRAPRRPASPSRAPRSPSGRSPPSSTSAGPRRECTWKAFTSTPPTLFMLLRMYMSGSPSACSTVRL